jgi:hypothetical protein
MHSLVLPGGCSYLSEPHFVREQITCCGVKKFLLRWNLKFNWPPMYARDFILFYFFHIYCCTDTYYAKRLNRVRIQQKWNQSNAGITSSRPRIERRPSATMFDNSNRHIESRCTSPCYRVVVSVLLDLGMLRKNYARHVEKIHRGGIQIFGGDIGLGVLDGSLHRTWIARIKWSLWK